MKRFKTLAALIAMFLLGGLTGWFQGQAHPRVSILHPNNSTALADHIMDRLKYRLDLKPVQIPQVQAIVTPVSVQIVQAQNEMLDKIADILAERDQQLAPLLNDEQKQKLAGFQDRRKKFLGHSN